MGLVGYPIMYVTQEASAHDKASSWCTLNIVSVREGRLANEPGSRDD